jgi:hypothetical protein
MPGFIEERVEHLLPGAGKEAETVELFERLDRRGDEQVDSRAYLRARLMDILMVDWDRHVDQWRWVRFDENGRRVWRPVPRDRDQPFSRFDAILPAVGQYYTKQLASFRTDYPSLEKLTFSGRFTDRRFLVPLEWRDWQEAVAEITARITDAVISDAVHQLPPAMYQQGGAEIERDLRARRDHLPDAAREFYLLLADDVDVRQPEDSGPIVVKQAADGVEVSMRRGDETIFHRTFYPAETSELRLYLPAGDKPPVVEPAAKAIDLRFAPLREIPPDSIVRDWGHDLLFFPQLSYDSTRGLVPGVRALLTQYAFEYAPFDRQMTFSASYGTGQERPRLEYQLDQRTHSPLRVVIYAAYSGIDGGRFYGLGNETVQTNPDTGFYELRQDKLTGHAIVEMPIIGALRARAGLLIESVHTENNNVVAQLQPYGAGWFTLPGGDVGLQLDTLAGVLTAQRGFKLLANLRYSPPWIDNQSGFTMLRGEATAALGAHLLTDLLLDLRVSGQRNWGRYPFFDAAYIGGAAFRSGLDVEAPFGGGLLRGFDLNRYAGDSSVVGNAELRIALGKGNVFLPTRFGIAGIADVGRVFVSGQSSSLWHSGVGGGLWVALFTTVPGAQIASSINLLVVRSDQGVSFYFSGGFGF